MIDKCELTATRVDPSRPRAARVLLLESGTGAGGSVNFLRDFLLNVDVTGMDPRAGFYFPNTSKTLKEIEQFGFSVTIFSSALPSAASGRPGVFDRRLKKIRFVRSLYRVVLRLLTIQLPIAWRVLRYIRKERIDLVVLNQDVHFHIPGVLAARLAGVPCVCRKAGGIGEARSLKRALNPWVELFVSISAATDADQRQTPGTKRLIKIYEGLDLSRFASPASREAMRDELAIPHATPTVTSEPPIFRRRIPSDVIPTISPSATNFQHSPRPQGLLQKCQLSFASRLSVLARLRSHTARMASRSFSISAHSTRYDVTVSPIARQH